MSLRLMQDNLDVIASCHRLRPIHGGKRGKKGGKQMWSAKQPIRKVYRAEKQDDGLHLVNDAAHGLICSSAVRQICL